MVEPTYFGYRDLRFAWGDHICAIFDEPSQQVEIMGGFMAHGLQAAQRCIWVAPAESEIQFRRTLVDLGADLPTLEGSGQLVIMPDVDFYLQKQLFEPERVMDLLRTLLADGQESGYETMRVGADVSWLRGHPLDARLWEEFEGRLTRELRGLPAAMVCQYDRRQLSGSIVVAAFRTHPIVILGGVVHQNPFYAPEGEETGAGREIV